MGQEETYIALEKAKRPLSRREIADITKERDVVISKHLKQMIKAREVIFIELDRIKVKDYCEKNKIPRVKQRMKLYFIKNN